MTTLHASTCVAPDCTARGIHHADCWAEACPGCYPRSAADGLRLCTWHTNRLADNAHSLATVYVDLRLALVGGGGWGEKVSGHRETGIAINEAAADARAEIRATLVGWCKLIAEERGISLPGRWWVQQLEPGFIGPPNRVWQTTDTVPAMCEYVGRHHVWLAATEYAGEVSDELRELARGLPQRIAYPSGGRKFKVAPCPAMDDCPGEIWTILRRDDSLLPSELVCDHDETHRWTQTEWLALGARLARDTRRTEVVA